MEGVDERQRTDSACADPDEDPQPPKQPTQPGHSSFPAPSPLSPEDTTLHVVVTNDDKNTAHCCCERRWSLFLFAFGCTSLVAGVIYGWPALRQQLIEDGSTLTERQLGAVYTAGSWSVQGGRFFTGLARDRYGTRAVACGALICTMAGAVGVALADASNAVTLGVSLFIMSLGAGCQLVMQPIGSLFPQTSNAIISSLSGSFQISGLVFLALTSFPSLTRRQAFLGYAGVVAILTVMAWWWLPVSVSFLPSEASEEATDQDDNQLEDNGGAEAEKTQKNFPVITASKDAHNEDNRENASSVKPNSSSPINNPTKLQQMISVEFLGLLAWFTILLVPMQYYVGSIGFQLEEKGDDGFYTDLFNIIYAAVAVLAPAGGYLSDHIGLGWTQGVSTVMVALSFFVLGAETDVIPLPAQTVGLVLYSVGRMLIFGMFFSNIGRRFGYANFGTLSGVGLLLSALFSILQYPLIAAASEGSASVVNFVSGSVLLCSTPYCVWLAVVERQHDKARSLLSVGP